MIPVLINPTSSILVQKCVITENRILEIWRRYILLKKTYFSTEYCFILNAFSIWIKFIEFIQLLCNIYCIGRNHLTPFPGSFIRARKQGYKHTFCIEKSMSCNGNIIDCTHWIWKLKLFGEVLTNLFNSAKWFNATIRNVLHTCDLTCTDFYILHPKK